MYWADRMSACGRNAGSRAARCRRGFSLVELLVVIAILALLASILVPSLGRAKVIVRRVQCGSNMHQWSNGLRAYAASNNAYFPENKEYPARHISWCSPTVQEFWKRYLIEWKKERLQKSDDVLYCPTQMWHRSEGALGNLLGLCGFFYLPHRDPATPQNAPVDYHPVNPDGEKWVTKQRFGDHFRSPILMDMKQYAGWIPGWYLDDGTPISSHRQPSGEPEGGNYLFEDGDVVWYRTEEIGLGATVGGWQCFYDIPLP